MTEFAVVFVCANMV